MSPTEQEVSLTFYSPLTGKEIAVIGLAKNGEIGVVVNDNVVLMPSTIPLMEEWARKTIAHIMKVNLSQLGQ